MKKNRTVVIIKKGEKIPNLNIDMTGWRGRIVDRGIDDILGTYYVVEWDSVTLDNIGFTNIYRMHKNNINWTQDIFGRAYINKAKARDTNVDVKNKVALLKEIIQNKDKRLQNKSVR